MAIVTTPLGFQKPDGTELLRNGDNVIAANADKAEQRIAEDRVRLAVIESFNTSQNSRLADAETTVANTNARVTSVESVNATQNIRIASVESAAFVGGGLLMEDPTDPGFFLVGA